MVMACGRLPGRGGGPVQVVPPPTALLLLLLLLLVRPGAGIQCYHCVNRSCYDDVSCNPSGVPVCDSGGSRGELIACPADVSTCKEDAFEDDQGE
ncbi:hypothetical protein FJT64_013372 [Amphibalanus amphitrite]|uniref:Uncharacterized protein n=1 Tax=Amphibalanus amphitrite TaxID=1232801 RepID=A0A6A4VCZ8_AMPAM|nr:hypothetical protein FJT64_013372 [Amphibalanus amphitrite]